MAAEKKGLFGFLGLFGKKSSEPAPSQSDDLEKVSGQPYLPKVGKTHRVAGLSYRKDNVLKLAEENPYYDLERDALIKKGYTDIKIFKYAFPSAQITLEQEPENPHDPNAIKVLVAGQHIGYVKAGSCAHVNKVINEGRIEQILCRISGGPWKALYTEEHHDPKKKPSHSLNKGTDDLRAEIRIVEIN